MHVLTLRAQPHPRGYTVELISLRNGSPRANLTRVLVVHLVEGGSSTTGEQTNTCYVKLKKEANHVGPTLEARLYTLEYAVSPAHGRGGSQDEVKLSYE